LFRSIGHAEPLRHRPKTLQWVLDRAVVAVERDGVDVLLIDPWNELERAKPRDMMMTDYIGQCLMYLKQFCRAMNVAVILVAHPTKAGVKQGKTPTLADIEGS
jgi:twinkle protein